MSDTNSRLELKYRMQVIENEISTLQNTLKSIRNELGLEVTPNFTTYFSNSRQKSRNKASPFKRSFSVWTVEEEVYLLENFESLGVLKLSKILQRSPNGVLKAYEELNT